ncbi:RNA helicase [Leptospira levettii]|uniref:DNA2/NAM7 family helicase n=1 Tax=Leptospira levettii TaxID=2023178 RepID=A0A5F2AFD5_9LEPT|nr:AAA domain-containing protein [Leptospira levettii]MCW7464134.1 DNA2/NAM7 family helicase [Leptospira levettii]MCW7495796.1 DNA2/NAM7 family helicase [Leptospira levettii]MCW7511680.1 DNA2/NAM7 family helicase [Leptospira levettii]MCW7515437.1 DNA2/NAM7 family helicase [Leptospira levettii]TGL67239.1 RNA helicase [Leptospira levettii]
MGRSIKQSFDSLEDEINSIESLLVKEREIERNLYLEKESESQIIKVATFVDLLFVVGNTWRAEFQVNLSNKAKLWTKQGVPVFIQNQNESIYGNIYQWSDTKLIIQVRGDYEWEGEEYQIRKWFPESTYDLYNEIFKKVKDEKDSPSYKKLKWILGYSLGDKPIPPKQSKENSPLERIFSILDFGMVFGPPGTGKTTLLMQAVMEIKNRNQSVLTLCPTNFACDYIVELACQNGIRVVRLGNSTKIKENVLPYHIDHLIETHPDQKQIQNWMTELKVIQKKINSWKRKFGKEEREERNQLRKEAKFLLKTIRDAETNIRTRLLDASELIVSTFAGFGSEFKKGREFDYVFVDEATQSVDPGCYMALFSGKKTFFFGDPKQLGVNYSLPEHESFDSFLEKAIEHDSGERTIFLEKQFRMKPEILGFPNQSYYDNQVFTHPDLQFQNIDMMKEIFGSDSAILWIDTAGSDTLEETEGEELSFINETEITLIETLMEKGLPKESTTIISPYRGQVERLIQRANGRWYTQTIDSFQGRESEIVILSLVRSNPDGEIGFLMNPKRLNVALTRAKFHLILIGDSATLCGHKEFQDLYNYIETHGEIRSIYEFME